MIRPIIRLHACFHDPDSRSWAVVQMIVALLVFISIGLLAVELVWEDDRELLEVVDRVILWTFVIELALRVGTFRPAQVDFYRGTALRRAVWHVVGRIRFLLRPLNLADALAVLAVVPALRGLRALRLLRLMRGVRIFRYANPFTGVARSFAQNRLPFVLAFGFLLVAIVMFGTTIYMVEHRNNDAVETLADGYWWAIVTITTVGFGDISPVTAVGRVLAAILMVVGMFTLALFAGIVGQTVLSAVLTIRQEEFRMGASVDHLVVCGYNPTTRRLLDEIILEVGVQFEHKLVVFARGERPVDLPSEFAWVEGDPTKESELQKVRMAHAALALIVGSHGVTPQQTDATTILTAFTVRSLLRRLATDVPRARPLYVIAEILDSENVDHARAAGCDEVIETTRLGHSLLAHATSMPGTAAIISEVAARGSQSLFVGQLDPDPRYPTTFAELSAVLKAEHGVLLVGVRESASDRGLVNPPSDHVVTPGTALLYFAPTAVLPRIGPR